MINRTKIIAITLTGALAAAALTGCGGSSSSAAPSSVSTAAAESSASSAAVSSVVDNAENGTDTLDGIYSTLLEQDPISNQFEIAAMNIEYDFGLQDQVAFYGNYAEFAQAQDNVENAVIAFKDNTVVMVIASNECTADLDSAVDNALA